MFPRRAGLKPLFPLPPAPDLNPKGVRSESADPDSLAIAWDVSGPAWPGARPPSWRWSHSPFPPCLPQEVDKRHHNGHGFLYKVWWREAGKTDARWNSAEVKAPPFLVRNAGTYTPFEIRVQAVNSLGSGPEPEAEIGRSGEDSRSPFSQTRNRKQEKPVCF